MTTILITSLEVGDYPVLEEGDLTSASRISLTPWLDCRNNIYLLSKSIVGKKFQLAQKSCTASYQHHTLL